MTISFSVNPKFTKSSFPNSKESSAPSTATVMAASPPAIKPITISGSTPNVGTHSAASSTPKRPLVPAPM